MDKNARIYIANHENSAAFAVASRLNREGFKKLLLMPGDGLDLLDQRSVENFFKHERPDYVFLFSIKSGGIEANIKSPAEFFYKNITAQNNIIHSSWKYNIKRLVFVGASCVYPKNCKQPMKEESVLTASLEPTSEPFSLAKIAGIKMCRYYNHQYKTRYLSVIPATIFGPGDDFDAANSHVMPALIKKIHDAKVNNKDEVAVWGTGKAEREFIYADDFADALFFIMRRSDIPDLINVGTGIGISIRKLAYMIKRTIGFHGNIRFDPTRPEGAIKKILDVTKITSLGWKARTGIDKAIKNTYEECFKRPTNQIINR